MANRKTGLRFPDVIDLVLASRDGTSLDLVVLDVGDVPEPSQRLAAFHRKLMSLANFVADGQYLEHAPGLSPSAVIARVVCHTPPTPDMRALQAVRASGPDASGIELRVTVETESEFQDRVERELGVRPPSIFQAARPWWRFW